MASVVGLALAGCGADGERPGLWVLADMARSVPLGAFDPNPLGAAGQTLTRPPEGTVPLDYDPLPPGHDSLRPLPDGRPRPNPVPETPAGSARGEALYGTFCAVCHGPKGGGDGPVIGPRPDEPGPEAPHEGSAAGFPTPPSLQGENARWLPDVQLYHVITFGRNRMPPYRTQLLPADRWRIVRHVRRLQRAPR